MLAHALTLTAQAKWRAARVMKQCVARIGNALLGESLWRFVRWSVGKKNLPHRRASLHSNVRDRWITAFLSERTSAQCRALQWNVHLHTTVTMVFHCNYDRYANM